MSEEKFTYPNFPKIKRNEFHFQRYLKFIESRKSRKIPEGTYTEKHHIVPTSLRGSDKKENLIFFTAREHYIAHLILWKCFGGSMTTSFWLMNHTINRSKLSGRMYENLKVQNSKYMSEIQKGKPRWNEEQKKEQSKRRKEWFLHNDVSTETRQKISEAGKKWKRPPELGQKISEKRKGHEVSRETRDKISKSLTGRTGVKKSKEWCEMMSKVHTGKTVSQDTRQLLRNSIKGRKFIHRIIDGNIERKQVPADELDYYLQKGWIIGANKGQEMKGKKSIYKIINGKIEQKFVNPEDIDYYLNKGWDMGTGRDPQNCNTQGGKKWMHIITNGIKKQKLVSKDEIDKYLSEGWNMGRGSIH